MTIRLFAAASVVVVVVSTIAAAGAAGGRQLGAVSGLGDCGGCDISIVGADGRGDRVILANQGVRGWNLFDLSPDHRKVLFARGPNLYVARTNGVGKRILVSGSVRYARWSPDGRMIAYRLGETHSCLGDAIWVINADGSEPHLVADCATQFSWSPDSRRLAFVASSGPNTDRLLAVVNVDGSGYRTISAPGVEIFDPTWAPRGEWIAYNDYLFEQGAIHVVHSDGSEEYTIARGSFGGWSPDGRRIAYLHLDSRASARSSGRASIRVVNRDGKRGRVVVRGDVDGLTAWSPNGEWITYLRTPHTRCPCIRNLFAVRINGKGSHALTSLHPNTVFGSIYWSRNSSRVFYLHADPWE